MPDKPTTIDEYLATLPTNQRAALERLRKTIRAAAPAATECISYGVPTFKLGGRMLVSFGAAAKHCSLYPGAHPLELLREAVAGYDISKGTIRFAPESPLPVALIRKLVRARIAQRGAEKSAPTSRPARAARRGSSGAKS